MGLNGGTVKSHYTRDHVKALLKMISNKEVIDRMDEEDTRDHTIRPPQFVAWNAAKLARADHRMVNKWIFRAYDVE